MQEAFEDFKEKLKTPSLLDFPNFDSPFVVETHASYVALGIVLSQNKDDGKVRPTQFSPGKMNEEESRSYTSETESTAFLLPIKKFLENCH